MRLKWWQKLLLNATIAAGVGFFGSLTALFSAGVTDWKYALIGAAITAGFTFFTTCQHYVNEKDPPTAKFEMKSPKKESPATPKDENKDVEVRSSKGFVGLAFI